MKNLLSFSFYIKKLFPITLLLLIYGCKDQSVSNVNLNWYNQRSSGNYPFSNEHVIVIKNFIGPVMVNGEISGNPSIRWFIDKKAEAETEQKAGEMFPHIIFEIQKNGDTLFATINSSLLLHVGAGIELDIPDSMVCIIEKVIGNVQVNYLDSLLTIKNASNVIVGNHSGSCEISSETGNISVEAALPDQGYCRINLKKGNVSINIPANVSATVYIRTFTGNVSYAGLSLKNIQQQTGFLSGTLGEGRGEIHAEVNQGNIVLQSIGIQ